MIDLFYSIPLQSSKKTKKKLEIRRVVLRSTLESNHGTKISDFSYFSSPKKLQKTQNLELKTVVIRSLLVRKFRARFGQVVAGRVSLFVTKMTPFQILLIVLHVFAVVLSFRPRFNIHNKVHHSQLHVFAASESGTINNLVTYIMTHSYIINEQYSLIL